MTYNPSLYPKANSDSTFENIKLLLKASVVTGLLAASVVAVPVLSLRLLGL